MENNEEYITMLAASFPFPEYDAQYEYVAVALGDGRATKMMKCISFGM
jgi:hypothetical protein